MNHYDAIVLGCGGVGSAALYHLAGRRLKTLGIEQFGIAHDRGSSHGQTRMIRKAYFEHPDYVPLVQRSYELWEDLDYSSGVTLFREVGLVEVGRAEGEVIRGVRESARRHDLRIDNLTADEARRRFPTLHVPDGYEAVYEPDAGYLFVEDCVRMHLRMAVNRGAQLHTGETVRAWRAEGSGVVVETDRDRYAADRLVITAGPWAPQILAELGIRFEIRRKPLYWFRTVGDQSRAAWQPAFLYDLPEGCFYSLPQVDDAGLKVAEHTGGSPVEDPLLVDRAFDAADCARVAEFVRRYVRHATPDCTRHTVCMYTMTPDAHFIVDRHPQHPQVVFAAGLSGHGFKFTPVLGEILAEMAACGGAHPAVGFLSARRESLWPV